MRKETDFKIGMLFKKMYCNVCGTKLKINKIKEIVTPEGNHYQQLPVCGAKVTTKLEPYIQISYNYYCNVCDTYIDYDAQLKINKKKLSDE